MTKQISKFLFLISITFSISCGMQDKKEIETRFMELKQQISENTFTEESLKYFDETSTDYIEKLIQYCNEENYYKVGELGDQYNCRLNSLIIYETATNFFKRDSTELIKVEIKDFLLWTKFVGPAFFRLDGTKRYKFQKVTMVDEKEGYANVIFNLGDHKTFITSKFKYVKEDGQWKLNFPSTMKFDENLLKQQLKRSHKKEMDFIKGYLGDESIDGSFYYRENK